MGNQAPPDGTAGKPEAPPEGKLANQERPSSGQLVNQGAFLEEES